MRPLPELPKTDIAAIVRDTWGRLGGGADPGTYVDTLAERAAGSPLFAETVTELARHAARPGEPLPALPLPDQLLPFLTAQLDALGDDVQETALRAAVLGRSATGAELAEVFGGDPVAIESHLSLLAEAAIARRTGARTWLRHATVAEALLARAAHGTRAPLHERVCRHLIAHDAPVREVARQLEHCQLPDLELRFSATRGPRRGRRGRSAKRSTGPSSRSYAGTRPMPPTSLRWPSSSSSSATMSAPSSSSRASPTRRRSRPA